MKKQRLKGVVQRTETVKVRCTKLEKKQIEKLAKSASLTTAGYMRKKSLNHKIHKTLTTEEIEAMMILSRNVNALIRISNLVRNRQPNLYHEIEMLVKNIQEWYQSLNIYDK